MKLTIEKHPDLIRLSTHLKKIELLADRMGIDVDDLLVDQKHTNISINPFSHDKDLNSFRYKRSEIFKNDKNRDTQLKPLSELTVLFNRSEK